MCHCGNDLSFLRPNCEYLLHKWNVLRLFKVLVCVFLEDGWCEWAETLAFFDLQVEQFFGSRVPRVCQDRSRSKCSGAKFCPAGKPTHHTWFDQFLNHSLIECVIVQ